MLDKIYYNTVLCQSFSPCGKYLVAGNIYGQLAVFDINTLLNPTEESLSAHNKPKYIHVLEPDSQICSLATLNKFLIVGSVNEIKGWEWKSVLNKNLGKSSWVIRPPTSSNIEQCEINDMCLSSDNTKLFAACGDNNVYRFDLEGGRLLSTFSGHTDYVHSVHGTGETLVSASEDGSVRLWDTRTAKTSHKIEPHLDSKLNRPDLGKWVGAASLTDDWMVCGGGPRLSLWHIRSLDAVTVFDIPNNGIHVSFFHDDCVIGGGASKNLYQLSYSGEIKVELPVSATTVYSVALRTEPNKVLTIAGSSAEIDLCSSFNYRDQVLHFR